MLAIFTLAFLFTSLASRAWCQSVQDGWTAPASPDNSTSLQSGNSFSIVWKSSLRDQFQNYCGTCNIEEVDLWVTSWDNDVYNYKIGGSINITSTLSYEWNVNIPTAALAAESLWVFRFTPFGSKPPFNEQISSAAVNITSPNAVPTSSASTSSAMASTTAAPPSTPPPAPSASTSAQSPATTSAASNPNTKSKAWIAGVVIGPLAGLGLGAALMWFLLVKRKKDKKVQQIHHGAGYVDGYHQPTQHVADKYHQLDSRPKPAEAPDREPSELWAGNYRK